MRLAVTFFRVDPSRGGAETYVRDLCHHLVRLGHRVDLHAHAWAEGALPSEVRCVRVAARGWARAQRVWDFARNSERALRAADYDCSVGFIHTWYQDVLIPQGGVQQGSLEANAKRFPIGWRRRLYRAARRANPKSWVDRAIERRQYDPAQGTRVIAVSGMVQGHLERFHGVPRPRIRVIPNAIDYDRLRVADPAATRRDYRARFRLRDDDLVALFVGHNFRLKGLPALLEALDHRRRRDPGVRPIHLLACGGGEVEPMRRQVARLGLGATVHLVGFEPDVRAAFWASDFFALPSYYDPCSLVVLEALACGLPVITTSCNGAGELITPGREGFVVHAPDARAHLADALDRMADDPARRLMAEHAARLGRAQSFDLHVGRLLAVFEEVAAEKAGRGGSSPHPSLRRLGEGVLGARAGLS